MNLIKRDKTIEPQFDDEVRYRRMEDHKTR